MSDEKIYIKLLKTGNNLGAFKVTADNYTTPTVSLISPNDATSGSGYDVSKTSFVVGSTQLDDTGLPVNDTRMLFDKTTGAFRAGTATSTQWDNVNRGTNSIALGLDNTASSVSSFAIGTSNTVSGSSSYTLGASNQVIGDSACAIGYNNNVSGDSSICIGEQNINSSASDNACLIGYKNSSSTSSLTTAIGSYCTVSANNAIAIGYGTSGTNNISAGTGSVAIGYQNNISSTNSVAIGSQNTASTAANATAIGQYCTATGANSFAIGYGTSGTNNISAGTGSVAIGYQNNVSGANSVAIGMNNTINAEQGYAIGNGSTFGLGALGSVSISTSNGLATNTITGLGNIAIGGGCVVDSAGAFIWRSPNNQMDTTIPQTVNNGSAHFVCTQDGIFRLSFGNQDGVQATGSATGFAWSGSSDINLKENLVEHTYSDTLDKIMKMPIYTYNFKTVAPGIKSIGPVAQDFNRLFPSDKDQLSIVERDMCGVALAGVKGVKLGLDSLSTTTTTISSAQQSQINILIESLTAANTQITALSVSLTAAIVRITALEGEAVTLKSKMDKLEKDKK